MILPPLVYPALSILVLSVAHIQCYAECHSDECRGAENVSGLLSCIANPDLLHLS
jgi:hypothetical protein